MSADESASHRTSRSHRRTSDGNHRLLQRLTWVQNASKTFASSPGVKPSTMRTVLMYLAVERSDNDGRCWPGTKTIGADLHLSPNQVQRALSALEQQGLLTRFRRHNDRGWRMAYEYRLSFTSTEPTVEVVEVDDGEYLPITVVPRDSPNHHRGETKPPPWGPTSHHRGGTEPSIENHSSNSSDSPLTHEAIARRAAEVEVDERIRKGTQITNRVAYSRPIVTDYLTTKADHLDRLVRCTDCTLDELAHHLRSGTMPSPRPAPYEPAPYEPISREQRDAALFKGLHAAETNADDETTDDRLANLDRIHALTEALSSRFRMVEPSPARESVIVE